MRRTFWLVFALCIAAAPLFASTQDDIQHLVIVSQTIIVEGALGHLSKGEVASLTAKIDAAIASLQRGNSDAASHQLDAAVHELEAMGQSGRVDSGETEALIALLRG